MEKGDKLEEEFGVYVRRLGGLLGHEDRHAPLEGYCLGLMVQTHNGRKSVEPMAAQVDPERVDARRQSMTHFVGQATWSDEALMDGAWDYLQERLGSKRGEILAWVVDDTGLPKKGKHSVGVAHQYCGALGKTANCQVAVCVSAVGAAFSMPMAWRLYLNEDWAGDSQRRAKAGVPEDVKHQPKWRLALDELKRLAKKGLSKAPVLADSAYGDVTKFREELRAMGWTYGVAISGQISVWAPGTKPQKPVASGQGRPPKLLRRTPENQPVSVSKLARELPADSYVSLTWRQGTQGSMRSRFAAVRVRPAHRDYWRSEQHESAWLLMEWPKDAQNPTDFWLCSLPESASLKELVSLVKRRWRIERDFQDMKDELGLDHYEGRGWRGFHHHATLCITTYAFLVANKKRFFSLTKNQFIEFQEAPAIRNLG